MAVMPREKWTDHRLDEFKENVDGGYARLEAAINASAAGLETKMADGFAQVDKQFEKVDERFAQVDKRFDKVDERFEKVEGKIESGIKELRAEMNLRFQGIDARFDSLQRSLFAATIVIIAAFIGTNAL
jgi:chromosome segregation ATPase